MKKWTRRNGVHITFYGHILWTHTHIHILWTHTHTFYGHIHTCIHIHTQLRKRSLCNIKSMKKWTRRNGVHITFYGHILWTHTHIHILWTHTHLHTYTHTT